MSRVVVTALALFNSVDALRPAGPVTTRRAVVAGLFAVPAAAHAEVSNPLNTDNFSGYKERNYGNEADTATGAKVKVTSCPEGQRLTPDGFGGKVCKGKVKTIVERVLTDDNAPPPPPRAAAAAAPAKKSVGERTSSSSSGQLTLEQLIENSITEKERFLGRSLDADERFMMAAKVKALLK